MKDEYYTPAKYIEAARAVMGGIDLDPASCEEANKVVRAGHFFSREDDGLFQQWQGNVWLNPPFSRQGTWAEKLLYAYSEKWVLQAIFLVQAATERKWFQPLWSFPICFSNHQILFNRPNNSPYHVYHGTCFVYLGPNIEGFKILFGEFGHVVGVDKLMEME